MDSNELEATEVIEIGNLLSIFCTESKSEETYHAEQIKVRGGMQGVVGRDGNERELQFQQEQKVTEDLYLLGLLFTDQAMNIMDPFVQCN